MNWSKACDWEVIEGARRGYEEAINEASKRGLQLHVSRPTAGKYWAKGYKK